MVIAATTLLVPPPAAAAPGDVTFESILPDGQNAPGYSFLRDITADGSVLFAGQTAPNSFFGLYLRGGGVTEQVDVDGAGNPGSQQGVLNAGVSDNGRFVAFMSTSHVFGGPGERIQRLVVRDRQTAATTYIGLAGSDTNGQDLCGPLDISDGAEVIAFSTRASLTSADTNTWCDVYVWTATANAFALVEGPPPADPLNPPSDPAGHSFLNLTPNGQFLVSKSDVGVDADRYAASAQTADIYVTDLGIGTRTLESVTNTGEPLLFGGRDADLTDDAGTIVFSSFSDPTGSCSPHCLGSTYLRDRSTGQSTAIATTPFGSLAGAADPTISADGLHVAAEVDWIHLATGQQGTHPNVAVYDVAADEWSLASHAVGTPDSEANQHSSEGAISADGATVGFNSNATDLVDPAVPDTTLAVYSYEVTGLADPDADGDLIDDVVDADGGTGTSPGEFVDGPLLGTIRSRPADMQVFVTDVAAPDGVRIRTEGTLGVADISVCGFTMKLPAGVETVVTCGSVIARVERGSVEIVLGDGQTVISIPAGVVAEVGDAEGGGFFVDVLADDTGAGATITNDGVTSTVDLDDGPTSVQAWEFDGFKLPVDNGTVNVVKAGKVVPLKWHLSEAGVPVTTLTTATLTFARTDCSSGAVLDVVEQTAAGGSRLRNLGRGDYQINWKTPGTRGACGAVQLDIDDGVLHTALFRLT